MSEGGRGRGWSLGRAGVGGLVFLVLMFAACVVTAGWTMGTVKPPGAGEGQRGTPRYAWQVREARQLPPTWWPMASDADEPWLPADKELAERVRATAEARAKEKEARSRAVTVETLEESGWKPTKDQVYASRAYYLMGTDLLGRDVLVRCLAGGAISLAIGLLAAAISVVIGTIYGAVAGYVGGRVDAAMMRIVDVLYGLPYVLLVVLLAVAADSVMDEYLSRSGARGGYVAAGAMEAAREEGAAVTREGVDEFLSTRPQVAERLVTEAGARYPERRVSERARLGYDLLALLIAIGGVSWLTMARVIRGQVLSLKSQPFVEAARAIGAPTWRIFGRHLLPNLVGPIIVYATLTVPQAILQESFLSFLGIGVKPPAPSWGSLAAEGLNEINPHHLSDSRWWLLVFPCVLLGCTLLALNFVGEGLREALDPKRAKR